MKVSPEIERKVEDNIFDLKIEDFQDLKRFFNHDNKSFVHFVNKFMTNIKKKEDLDKFLYFFESLKNEITDVSPFLSANINRIFSLMIKNNYYKQLAENSDLLDNCANIKILEMLTDFIKSQGINKYLTSVEIYKIKKLVFDLSKKFKKPDVAYKIQIELEKEDAKWQDHIES